MFKVGAAVALMLVVGCDGGGGDDVLPDEIRITAVWDEEATAGRGHCVTDDPMVLDFRGLRGPSPEANYPFSVKVAPCSSVEATDAAWETTCTFPDIVLGDQTFSDSYNISLARSLYGGTVTTAIDLDCVDVFTIVSVE